MAANGSMTVDSISQNGRDDLEKSAAHVTQTQISEQNIQPFLFKRLASYGVEIRGILPVALEDRTDTRPINIFSFWWTASMSLNA
jgi:hypothetical protein